MLQRSVITNYHPIGPHIPGDVNLHFCSSVYFLLREIFRPQKGKRRIAVCGELDLEEVVALP